MVKKPKTRHLLSCLELCLDNNIVEYNGIYSIPRHHYWTKNDARLLLPGNGSILINDERNIAEKLFIWKRYIDDIWGLWDNGEQTFLNVMEELNAMFSNELMFTFEINYSKVVYLDLEITLTGGRIKTKLFTKLSGKDTLYLRTLFIFSQEVS